MRKTPQNRTSQNTNSLDDFEYIFEEIEWDKQNVKKEWEQKRRRGCKTTEKKI